MLPMRIDPVVLRENPGVFFDARLRRGATLALGAATAITAALARASDDGATQGFLLCASGVMALTAFALGAAHRQGSVATLELSDDALAFVQGRARTEVPCTSILEDSLHSNDDGSDELRIVCDDGRAWSITLPNDDAVDAVRATLRRAMSRRTLTVPLRGGLDTSALTALVMLLAIAAPMPLADAVMRTGGVFVGMLAWAAGFALAARLVMEVCVARVTVGDDGIALQRNGAEQFVPWSSVADADWDELGVVVRLTDGTSLSLPVLSHSMVRGVRDGAVARAVDLRDALYDRVRAGLDAWRDRTAAGDPATALLDRRGRTVEDWQAAARALLLDVSGYREMHFDVGLAARVIDDPAEPLERRVAAVWALRTRDAARASTRVRVALDAAASEPVREALDLAAREDADPDALDRALAAAASQA